MAKYTGGEKVGGGYYWNVRNWEVEVVPSEGGRLKATAGTRVKVPFPALFAYAIVRKVTGGVKQGATELAATVQPGSFAAGSAYFTGKPGEEEKKAEGAGSPELERLEKEIAARKEK